jgi:hypothetical protein
MKLATLFQVKLPALSETVDLEIYCSQTHSCLCTFCVLLPLQEPRLGRWAVDKAARNGVLVHRIELSGQ